MDKISQDGRDERTRLKICPEVRDAWTKICHEGRDERTRLKICPEVRDAWTKN